MDANKRGESEAVREYTSPCFYDFSAPLNTSIWRRNSLAFIDEVEDSASDDSEYYDEPTDSSMFDIPCDDFQEYNIQVRSRSSSTNNRKGSSAQLSRYNRNSTDASKKEGGDFDGPVVTKRRKTSPRKAPSYLTRSTRGSRHMIQHHYRDHACDPDDLQTLHGRLGSKPSSTQQILSMTKKKGGVAVPFPLKLHELLEKAEAENLTHIVSWQPHGRAFVVHDPKTFVKVMMPRFFRQTKLTSFQRQLNLYGFSRLTRGRDSGGYYHELFLRGKTYLTRKMIRTKIKGTGYKAATNPSSEPDFYDMPAVVSTPSNTALVINNNLDFSCESVSDDQDYDRLEDDAESVHDAFVSGINVPIVTPTNSFSMIYSENSIRSDWSSTLPGIGPSERTEVVQNHQGEVWPCFEFLLPSFPPNCCWGQTENVFPCPHEIPPLPPRRAGKVIRMGNQSFQYMESFQYNDCKLEPGSKAHSIHLDESLKCQLDHADEASPVVRVGYANLDGISVTDSLSERNDSSSPYPDPLDVFLEEMGGSMDDGINVYPSYVKEEL